MKTINRLHSKASNESLNLWSAFFDSMLLNDFSAISREDGFPVFKASCGSVSFKNNGASDEIEVCKEDGTVVFRSSVQPSDMSDEDLLIAIDLMKLIRKELLKAYSEQLMSEIMG